MSKIKNDGLDQYGAELFEQQQFGTTGVEGVKTGTDRAEISLTEGMVFTYPIFPSPATVDTK